MKAPIICLLGATAAGKTDLALALVDQLPCDIISVDSALVYRGMDIGTAKPDASILQRAPHRLLDIREINESYSAADFCEDARREIDAIIACGRIPLLVGGTMLYFHALQHGLAQLPAADAALRQRLLQQAEIEGWAALHQRLQQVDPLAAAKIHANDGQRIQRALEVYEVSGKPISEFWQQADNVDFPYRVLNLALLTEDREALHQRIAQRLQAMFAAGFVAEVEALFKRSELHPPPAALRAVGYRQVWQFLAGELDEAQMRDAALFATRQLAKRQLTWLRSWQNKETIVSEASDRVAQSVCRINDFLGC